MRIGILKEGKTPPDKRVPFAPDQIREILDTYPNIEFRVQKSNIRCFNDDEYQALGIPVVDSVEDCDILMGVKEVPIDQLIADKTYFFFSHTFKKQPYNRNLLIEMINKNIELLDYEGLAKNGLRILGFGRYAGIVGCYNAFLTYGKRNKLYDLKPAHQCADRKEMEAELSKVKVNPEVPLRIVLTGNGRVAHGAMEVLNYMSVPKLRVEDYLSNKHEGIVYCQLRVTDYNKRKDGSAGSIGEFYKTPEIYDGDFLRFAAVTDLYIPCHFWKKGSPYIFSRKDAKRDDFNIQVVADISCDIDGPVASTLRPSTIADPVYGYDPTSESETAFNNPNAISVMAVDNLPCELPKDASRDFGNEFIKNVLPALFDNDKDEILKNATICKNGRLTDKYLYLTDYVNQG
ncbi:MAG: alanine dehydrogenase [Crocinitomicaceae bacterium]|nr:alanine dehydrogenase [Crocinitomicaceae bacterium]